MLYSTVLFTRWWHRHRHTSWRYHVKVRFSPVLEASSSNQVTGRVHRDWSITPTIIEAKKDRLTPQATVAVASHKYIVFFFFGLFELSNLDYFRLPVLRGCITGFTENMHVG